MGPLTRMASSMRAWSDDKRKSPGTRPIPEMSTKRLSLLPFSTTFVFPAPTLTVAVVAAARMDSMIRRRVSIGKPSSGMKERLPGVFSRLIPLSHVGGAIYELGSIGFALRQKFKRRAAMGTSSSGPKLAKR
jgi:hypothetical protein